MKDKPLIIEGSAVHTEDLTMELYDCGDSKPLIVEAVDWGHEDSQALIKHELFHAEYARLEERVLSDYIFPIRAAEPIYDMLLRDTYEMSRHSRFMNPAPITNHQKKKRDVIKARRAKDKANRKRGR